MLGKSYTFSRDCCGSVVVKHQTTEIKIKSVGNTNLQEMTYQNDSMNHLPPLPMAPAKEVYHSGKLYKNAYLHYCLCASLYTTHSW